MGSKSGPVIRRARSSACFIESSNNSPSGWLNRLNITECGRNNPQGYVCHDPDFPDPFGNDPMDPTPDCFFISRKQPQDSCGPKIADRRQRPYSADQSNNPLPFFKAE